MKAIVDIVANWYYRYQLKHDGGRLIRKLGAENLERLRKTPKVPTFSNIPENVVWEHGIPFTKPNIVVPWQSDESEFKSLISYDVTSRSFTASIFDVEFPRCYAHFESVFMPPHGRHGTRISSLSLIGPFRKGDTVLEEYITCTNSLFATFGPPNFEDQILSSWNVPEHTKQIWHFPHFHLIHDLTDLRDSDPVNYVQIFRTHSAGYLRRYPSSEH